MAAKLAEQKELTFLQANLNREAQAKLEEDLTRQTKKECKMFPQWRSRRKCLLNNLHRNQERMRLKWSEMMKKMTFLEDALVQQRKKSMT